MRLEKAITAEQENTDLKYASNYREATEAACDALITRTKLAVTAWEELLKTANQALAGASALDAGEDLKTFWKTLLERAATEKISLLSLTTESALRAHKAASMRLEKAITAEQENTDLSKASNYREATEAACDTLITRTKLAVAFCEELLESANQGLAATSMLDEGEDLKKIWKTLLERAETEKTSLLSLPAESASRAQKAASMRLEKAITAEQENTDLKYASNYREATESACNALITRTKLAAAFWEELLETANQGLAATSAIDAREDLKTFWKTLLERAETEKTSLLTLPAENASKAQRAASMSLEKAIVAEQANTDLKYASSYRKATEAACDALIARTKPVIAAWEKLLDTANQALAAASMLDGPEDLKIKTKTFWETIVATTEKNKAAANFLCAKSTSYNTEIARGLLEQAIANEEETIADSEKANAQNNRQHLKIKSEIAAAFGDAIVSAHIAQLAWNEILQTATEALRVVPADLTKKEDEDENLEAFWNSQISIARHQQSAAALLSAAQQATRRVFFACDQTEAATITKQPVLDLAMAAKTAWQELIKELESGSADILSEKSYLRECWRTWIERAESSKKKQAALALGYAAKKASSIADESITEAQVMVTSDHNIANRLALWDLALKKREEAADLWKKAAEAYRGYEKSAPINLDYWKTQTENVENIKNQESALVLCHTAQQAMDRADYAYQQFKAAPTKAKRSELLEQANSKKREAETAWDEAIQRYHQGRLAVPIVRDDLKTWWSDEIKTAENTKKSIAAFEKTELSLFFQSNDVFASAVGLQDQADQAASSASEIQARAEQPSNPHDALILWEEAVQKADEAQELWGKAQEAFREVFQQESEQIPPALKAESEQLLKNIANEQKDWMARAKLNQAVYGATIALHGATSVAEGTGKMEKEIVITEKIMKALGGYEDAVEEYSKLMKNTRATPGLDAKGLAVLESNINEEIKELKRKINVVLVDLLDFRTERDQAIFWTGYPEGNQTLAMRFGSNNNKKTLEMTAGGSLLDALNLYGPGSKVSVPLADELFDHASERFARGAMGDIHSFLPSTEPREGSVFKRIEQPILAESPYVDSIERHFKLKKNWRTVIEKEEENKIDNDFSTAALTLNNDQSIDWIRAHFVQQQAERAALLNFQTINRADKTPYPKEAIACWKAAIEEAESTQGLWTQTLQLFQQGRAQVSEALKDSVPLLLKKIENEQEDWKAGVNWCKVKREETIVNTLQGRVDNALAPNKFRKITLSTDEISALMDKTTDAIRECQLAATRWKESHPSASENDAEAMAFLEKNSKDYEYIATKMDASNLKVAVSRAANAAISMFHKLTSLTIGIDEVKETGFSQGFQEAQHAYEEAANNYLRFLQNAAANTAPLDRETRAEWNKKIEEAEALKKKIGLRLTS
ncbi:MAG: hypothetical protein ACH346_07160 [Chthoniobacterales bacterium]